MSKHFTLGKTERLKSRKLIEGLFKQGKSLSLYPFRVYYLCGEPLIGIPSRTNSSFLQFGVGVSARHFKRAVDRNRVKRLTREGYRLQKRDLQQLLEEKKRPLALFFIYTGKELPLYQALHDKIGLILERLKRDIQSELPG